MTRANAASSGVARQFPRQRACRDATRRAAARRASWSVASATPSASASTSTSSGYVGVSVHRDIALPSVGDPMVVGATFGALAAGAMYVGALKKRLQRAARRAARAEDENAELEWRLRVATSSMDPNAQAARPRQQQASQRQYRSGGDVSASTRDAVTRDVVVQGLKDEIEALKLTLAATRAESRAERLRAETNDARDILRATRAALGSDTDRNDDDETTTTTTRRR